MSVWARGDKVQAKDQFSGKWKDATLISESTSKSPSSLWVEFESTKVSQKTPFKDIRRGAGASAGGATTASVTAEARPSTRRKTITEDTDEEARLSRVIMSKGSRSPRPGRTRDVDAKGVGGKNDSGGGLPSLNLTNVNNNTSDGNVNGGDSDKDSSSLSIVISPRPINMTAVTAEEDTDGDTQSTLSVHLSPRPISMEAVVDEGEQVDNLRARLMKLKKQIQEADAETARRQEATEVKRQQRIKDEERAVMLKGKITEQQRLLKKAKIRPALPAASRQAELEKLKQQLDQEKKFADKEERSQRRSSWIAPEGLMEEISAFEQKLVAEQTKQKQMQQQLDETSLKIEESRAQVSAAAKSAPVLDRHESEDLVHYRELFKSTNGELAKELSNVSNLKTELDGDLDSMKQQLADVEKKYEDQIATLKTQLEELRV